MDPTPTTLTARTPDDLLVAAAVVLGFWPADSVVMLTFGGAHKFHARLDLPATSDADALREAAEALAKPAARHRAERVVLLLYSDDAALVAAAWPVLRRAFTSRRIGLVEVLHVGSSRWRTLLGRGPAVRYDRDALDAHPFLAQAVLAGRVTRDSRAELAATLEPDPGGVARVAALLPLRGAPTTPQSVLAEGTWAEGLVGRHLADGTTASDADAARLLTGMVDPTVRDAAWSAIARELARAAIGFFGDLVRRSPPEVRAAPAALTGWAAWQVGDGALAWCALDRCDDVQPGYGLANTLAEVLERAVPPGVWHDGFDWKERLDPASSQ